MATREFVFEVHYRGHIDRRFMNSYVGGDVDVYTDAIQHDRVSFSVVEDIAKSYGYKSGDLIYYLLPRCTLRNGLKLITSNFDVNEMVQAYLGLPIVELYINSFSESIPDIDEGNDEDNNDNDNDNDNDDDERGYSRIERDDPYWEEVNEPDLFVDNDDVPGPSMGREGALERLETSMGRVGRKVMVVWKVKRAMKVMRVKRKVMQTKVG
jgi:hypothetical protein